MLTMAPDRCRRITGSVCLQAMTVPRRLMAETRSKASSVISVGGASPPARLTPTLLCRMSMRPQRLTASSTAAFSVASLVTSASKGTHSPRSSAMIAAVSFADSRLLSTASTLAPLRANSSAVARPLPKPSPGPCPAPTTMAILSPSRMVSSILSARAASSPRASPTSLRTPFSAGRGPGWGAAAYSNVGVCCCPHPNPLRASGVRESASRRREPHVALGADRPGWVPGDLPGVIVGIGDIAAHAAMRRRIRRPQDAPAEPGKAVQHRLHLLGRADVVRQGERAGPGQGPLHVILEPRAEPGAEDEAVHLVEDDLCVLEHRRPAEAVAVEPLRPGEVGDAEGDDGELLLHGPRPLFTDAALVQGPGHRTWRASSGTGT